MSLSLQRGALAALLGLGIIGFSAAAQAQTAPASPSGAQAAAAASAPASAPAGKKKRTSHAKTPPGKPPAGAGQCNQGDKATRQRCLNDMYGPGGPRI
jgi:hypothetical protein